MNEQVFNELGRKLNKYERECKAWEDTKEQMREELSDDDFWAWLKKNDRPEYPLSGGQSKAYRLWRWNRTDELVFDDYVWERESHDFIETLREAEVDTFVLTTQSTALMENMHWFVAEGARMVGLCKVETGDERYDFETNKYVPEVKMGVRFAL